MASETQHWNRNSSHLIIFVPGQGLSSQDKPVLLGASLHDADIEGEPAFPDHLQGEEEKNRGIPGGRRKTAFVNQAYAT